MPPRLGSEVGCNKMPLALGKIIPVYSHNLLLLSSEAYDFASSVWFIPLSLTQFYDALIWAQSPIPLGLNLPWSLVVTNATCVRDQRAKAEIKARSYLSDATRNRSENLLHAHQPPAQLNQETNQRSVNRAVRIYHLADGMGIALTA